MKNYQNTRIFFIYFLPEKLTTLIIVTDKNGFQLALISRIIHDICSKIPELYVIIAREIFFPKWGGTCSPAPVSYAYANGRMLTTN